jgi:hypothetical protein
MPMCLHGTVLQCLRTGEILYYLYSLADNRRCYEYLHFWIELENPNFVTQCNTGAMLWLGVAILKDQNWSSIYLSIYLSIYDSTVIVGPCLTFSFLILYTAGRTPWTGDHPVAGSLPIHRTTQTQNKFTQIPILRVGFEHPIPAFERTKTVHTLDGAAIVIDQKMFIRNINCRFHCLERNTETSKSLDYVKALTGTTLQARK